MELKTKLLVFFSTLFILVNIVYSTYQITVDFENCNNILIEISSNYISKPIEKNESVLYYVCFSRKNNSLENCQKTYESDFIVITSFGIKKINYKSFILDYIPEKIIIRDSNNNLICESIVNSCIKDGICNNLCGYDEDCFTEKTIFDIEKISENLEIEFKKIDQNIKIAIIIIIILIAILIWKFMK
ncbi:MAG: hypothetical protein QW714_01875 [Nanopusillaceae archaeon]